MHICGSLIDCVCNRNSRAGLYFNITLHGSTTFKGIKTEKIHKLLCQKEASATDLTIHVIDLYVLRLENLINNIARCLMDSQPFDNDRLFSDRG